MINITQKQMELKDRIYTRLPDEVSVNEMYVYESIRTIADRLNLRLGTIILPEIFESILVDAVVKMIRRQYFEGIKSERVDTITTHFVDDILDEYKSEIAEYRSAARSVVRFL